MEEKNNLLQSHKRKQGLIDGSLVDISEIAQLAGIKWPIAITKSYYDYIITPPPSRCPKDQLPMKRLWNLARTVKLAIESGDNSSLLYARFINFCDPKTKTRYNLMLKVRISEGENSEQEITVE